MHASTLLRPRPARSRRASALLGLSLAALIPAALTVAAPAVASEPVTAPALSPDPAPVATQGPARAPVAPDRAAAIARAALARTGVFDGHNDVPEQLRARLGNQLAGFDFADTRGTARDGRAAMHTDLARLRQGRVTAQWWSVWVDPALTEAEAVQRTAEQIDVTRRLIARYPRELAFATTAAEVEAAMKAGRVAGLIGMEGGHSIGSSLGVLRQMHALGARYMTLTHWANTPWADAATDAPRHGGLTDFGRDVVREMNRLGMVVDLSHVSEETMLDVLDTTGAPVMFSHSGARAVNPHPRNVPDSVLARMKANGGIVMAVFLPGFVSAEVRAHGAARAAEEARLKVMAPGDPAALTAGLAAWDAANPVPRATLAQTADHIEHIIRVAGIDHVGVGGDYDGMDSVVEGLEDVATYPALFTELARRGYTQAELEKIAAGNMLRVLRGVEAAARARAGDPPIETRSPTATPPAR